jgi:hypothetical protein
MLSDLMQRVRDMFKPYTLEDFMEDAKPVDHKDLQRLEKIWEDYQTKRLFNSGY